MSADVRPEPYTTPDIDVRDLDGFMLNTERLLASELWALSTGDEFKAAMALWCRAWKQMPAASLPADERVLASFAGVPVARWAKLRPVAMRGFDLCSDGRYYHRVLADDAKRAMMKKTERRERTKAATEARKKLRDGQRDDERNVDRDDERNDPPDDDVTRSQRQGQGQKKEREIGDRRSSVAASAPPPAVPRSDDQAALDLIEAAEGVLLEHYGRRRVRHHGNDLPLARGWVERGIGPERLVAILDKAVGKFAGSHPDDLPTSLKLFAPDIDREEPIDPYPSSVRSPKDREVFDLVEVWKVRRDWFGEGPAPNDPATLVPDHVLAAAGLARRKAPTPRQVPQSASA